MLLDRHTYKDAESVVFPSLNCIVTICYIYIAQDNSGDHDTVIYETIGDAPQDEVTE